MSKMLQKFGNAFPIASKSRLRRSDSKLLVFDNTKKDGYITSHKQLKSIIDYLQKGDVLVVNQSATLPASFQGQHLETGSEVEIRLIGLSQDDFSKPKNWKVISYGKGDWKTKTEDRVEPPTFKKGDIIIFSPTLIAEVIDIDKKHKRIMEIEFHSTSGLWQELYRYGKPIQYSYLEEDLQIWDQQTIFSSIPSSVEPPSASFQLNWELLHAIQKMGVKIVPIIHAISLSSTGIKEIDDFLPFPERYEIRESAATLINTAKSNGNNVIAVGTSVMRALEDSSNRFGKIIAGKFRTSLVINQNYWRKLVDGLLTGMHIPGESHIQLLQAFIHENILQKGYEEAITLEYLWHEFGDLTLIINPIKTKYNSILSNSSCVSSEITLKS